MSGRSELPESHVRSVDQIFTWIAEAPSRPPPARVLREQLQAPTVSAPEPTGGPVGGARTEGPPGQVLSRMPPSGDLQTEYEWLREERQRLEAYTLGQFALIKQQREELLGRKAGIEESLALREQELNRQLKLVTDGTEALRQRDRELSERETALAVQTQRISQAAQECRAFQESNARLRQENESQRLQAEQLRIQLAHLQEAVRFARSELAAVEQAARKRKEALDSAEVELAASRTQLGQRFAEVERAEASLRRRESELDQLEAQLRRELEERERSLEEEARELEKAQVRFRLQAQRTPQHSRLIDTPLPPSAQQAEERVPSISRQE